MTFAMHANDRPNRDEARVKARELTKVFSVPSIPVVEVAEMNGVNVVFSDMGKFSEDVAGLLDFKARRIYVNKADHPNRQRFTIAHELGHWMLHKAAFEANPGAYPVLPRFQKVEASNAFEQEANAFASELLVPDHLLKQVLGAPVSALADVFDVSRTMMEIRLQNVR
ncbi:ImmA/IrrE family metallo-endopeptidase [Ochrobactrum sp. XJ1]|nr:ImmA/IrrE family metallo-endopeptidase [Ochrobactrum sp. XJ1]